MPGHAPAGPPHAHGGADVIPMRRDRRRHPAAVPHGNAAPQLEEPVPAGAPTPAEEQLLRVVEGVFVERGLTLADPQTAEAFHAALDLAVLAVDAARAKGAVDHAGQATITDTITNMRNVPGWL
uniref:Uncharacterized protein n=2 Tax=Streptomyces sp. W75 TaxID=1170711 RepID=I0CEM7_9ACTN|nr:hypothetical protein pCQ4.115 [Streptomyces sp. W75]